MSGRVYLDWNASAPLRPEAGAVMAAACDIVGNPSSVHAEGRAARAVIENAREKVAKLVGVEPAQVTFTSGGTEANGLALTPMLERPGQKAPRQKLLVSALEHPSVLAGGRFARRDIEQIPATGAGIIDLPALKARLDALAATGAPALVSLMAANNETGAVQPVAEAAQLTHEAGGLLHVDAVQAPGRIACDFNALGADLMTLSGHKLGGPKGVGALVRREGLHIADPLVKGGGQERGLRAGTENLAAIAGFGAAAAALAGWAADAARMRTLRDRLEAGIRKVAPEAVIFASSVERLPNTTFFSAPGLKAETAVIAFDLEGFAVSSGSACSSGKVQPSHVLAAMGLEPALARGAIRVSIGPSTEETAIDSFLGAWNKHWETLGKRRRSIAA